MRRQIQELSQGRRNVNGLFNEWLDDCVELCRMRGRYDRPRFLLFVFAQTLVDDLRRGRVGTAQRLRVGDMVAGTMVVMSPKAVLIADLGGRRPRW